MSNEEREKVLVVLRALAGNLPPFEHVIAELAGVAPGRLNAELEKGVALAEEGATNEIAMFALEFRQKQAVWKLQAIRRLVEDAEDPTKSVALRELRWILERLDRAVFDLSKPAQPVQRREPRRDGKKVPDLKKAIDLLEKA